MGGKKRESVSADSVSMICKSRYEDICMGEEGTDDYYVDTGCTRR